MAYLNNLFQAILASFSQSALCQCHVFPTHLPFGNDILLLIVLLIAWQNFFSHNLIISGQWVAMVSVKMWSYTLKAFVLKWLFVQSSINSTVWATFCLTYVSIKKELPVYKISITNPFYDASLQFQSYTVQHMYTLYRNTYLQVTRQCTQKKCMKGV